VVLLGLSQCTRGGRARNLRHLVRRLYYFTNSALISNYAFDFLIVKFIDELAMLFVHRRATLQRLLED
jgi:hypothetical protein